MAASNVAANGKLRFQKAINAAGLRGEELGVYLQRLARIAYLVDPPESLKIQQGARERSLVVAIPPSMPRKPVAPSGKTSAEKFCAWFLKFSPGNAAVIEAKRIADRIDLDSKPKQVEGAIKDLGEALGADSSRPDDEYAAGPDNLWFWGGTAFVIEAKNLNHDSLHKSDSGQLHDSVQWAQENYPQFANRIQPIVVAKVTKADADANFPNGTRVLMQEGCRNLGRALHQLCQKLAMQGPVFVTPENVLTEMANFGLLPEQLVGRHTSKLD
jgi:hypothetical protein